MVYESICEELLVRSPRKTKIEVPKDLIGDPLPAWRRSIGWPNRDTVRQFRDGVFHIHETSKGTYRIHRDAVDPQESPVLHLLFDMPLLCAGVAVAAAGMLAAFL